MNARITLIGTENVLNYYDKSITDTWALDSESFDKDVLLSSIITRGGQFEPLYSDPNYFYIQCSFWWKKYKRTFDKWFYAFDQEYNPLWDRNGFEEIHEDTKDIGTSDTITKNKETVDDDTTVSSTVVTDNDTTGHVENKVSAYDKDTYQPHDESDSRATDDTTQTTNGSGTDDRTTDFSGNIDNDTTNDRDFDRTYHSWGNWGISMTSQKLLEQEIKVQRFSIYDHIADLFCNDLLIQVY